MLKKIGMMALGVFTIFCGLGLIEMGVLEPTYELASRIFASICGGILALGGVAILYLYATDPYESVSNGEGIRGFFKGFFRGLLEEVTPDIAVVTEDHSDKEALLRSFRKDHAAFFEEFGVQENAAVQNDVTQIYLHILTLQKQRLDRKRIVTRAQSERVRYGTRPAVRVHTFFDGKYRITDASEILEARQTFGRMGEKKGRPLYSKKTYETGRYRLLSAERKGGDVFICPNCGSRSTRENLLDGCDYCGTKFTLEDLGTRISQFSYRPDYEVEYARYTEVRATYAKRVGLFVGIPVFLLCLYGAIMASWDFTGMYTLRIAAIMFTAAFPTAAAVYFSELFFFFGIFPFLQAGASFRYVRGRQKAIEAEKDRDDRQQRAVRKNDPLFSLQGFYSWVENILAAIHYGEEKGASAFTENSRADEQIAACLKKYQDVIDMEVMEIRLEEYQAGGRGVWGAGEAGPAAGAAGAGGSGAASPAAGAAADGSQMQEALVTAKLQLLVEKNGRIRKKKEQVRLHLVKSAACRTQAVCAPSFMYCRNCGASLSLQEGKTCPHCGTERRLADQEWVVRDYVVM